jgi:2-phospho-L-lactate/phosphoenolpyruvate guanylyltransferase
MVSRNSGGWSLVVPVKVLAHAKSRLTGLDGGRRAALALAMAADTVAAAAACPAVGRVIVVTDDDAARAELASLGAIVIGDDPAAGLNAALEFGAEYAQAHWPGHGRAGLAGDLPALSQDELGRALAAASGSRLAFVPDAAGTGTTLYTAGPGEPFCPHFGPASGAAHQARGAIRLDIGGIAGLRRDVDTVADLKLAAEIGLGPRTRAAAVALLAGLC